MAKKKWSFNAFVAGKNLNGSNKICDIGIEMDMRLSADSDILIFVTRSTAKCQGFINGGRK